MEAIADVPTHLAVLQKYGLAVYLSLFFSIGTFIFLVLLVKKLLAMHEKEKDQLINMQEKERASHQEFLSEAVKSNTSALIMASERLSDLGSTLKGISESLIRIESANRYQREEHVVLTQQISEVKKDVSVSADNIKDISYRIRDVNK